MITSYRSVVARRCGLCLSLVVSVLASTPAMARSAAPTLPSSAAQFTEPVGWDVYFLFLLRILMGLFGGNPESIFESMDPLDAMEVVSSHYTNQGVPPTTLLGRLLAQTTILTCKTHILSSSRSTDPSYQAFVEVLDQMYDDVD
jgi:hypothetical protein